MHIAIDLKSKLLVQMTSTKQSSYASSSGSSPAMTRSASRCSSPMAVDEPNADDAGSRVPVDTSTIGDIGMDLKKRVIIIVSGSDGFWGFVDNLDARDRRKRTIVEQLLRRGTSWVRLIVDEVWEWTMQAPRPAPPMVPVSPAAVPMSTSPNAIVDHLQVFADALVARFFLERNNFFTSGLERSTQRPEDHPNEDDMSVGVTVLSFVLPASR